MDYKRQSIIWRMLMIMASIIATLIGLAMIVNNMLNGVGKAVSDGLNDLCSLDSGHCNSPVSYRENSFTSEALTPYVILVLLAMVATVFLEISSSGKRSGQKELPKLVQNKALGVGVLKSFTLLSVYAMISSLALQDNSESVFAFGIAGFALFLALALVYGRKLRQFEKTLQTE